MQPASSAVVPSVASGAGYGMFFVLAALVPAGNLPGSVWFTLVAYCLAFLLATTTLLASLGRREQADEEMPPLRTVGANWPFRERMAALLACATAGVLAIERLVRIDAGVIDGTTHALAAASALAAAVAAICAAKAHAAAATHGSARWAIANLVLLALMTGSLWVYGTVLLFGGNGAMAGLLALASIAAGGLVKRGYWRSLDRAVRGSPAERLRVLAAWGAYSVPALLIIAAGLTGTGWPATVLAIAAATIASAGVVVERRLFFGEMHQGASPHPGQSAA